MQRLMALLMVFVLLTGVLMGCTPNEQLGTQSSHNTRPSSESTAPTTVLPTDPTSPTEPTVPDEPDFFTRHGQAAPEADQIPGYAEATDTANLYALPLELPGPDTVRSILNYGDTLYISYWKSFDGMGGQCSLRAYDLSTGSTLYDTEYPGWSDMGLLADGGFWYISYETMTVELIDAAGQHTTVTLPQDGEDKVINYIYIDPSAQYLVILYDSGTPVEIYDLKTGAVTTPEFMDGEWFYSAQYQDGRFLLNDHDDGIYLLDPKTGEYEHRLAGHTFGGVQGGIGFWAGTNYLELMSLDGDPIHYYLGLEDGKWFTDMSHGFAVLGSYAGQPLSHVVDLRNHRYVAEISFPEGCYGTFDFFLDNGSLLLVAVGDSENVAYLYDTSVPPEDDIPLPTYIGTGEGLETETAQIAQDIQEATGIEILYGSQGNDFILGDYVGIVELEPYKVFHAVKTVAGILDRYPEGMLREAWDIGYDGLKIYLCGSIYGVYAGGLDTAGGVTSETDDYIVIAVDINNPIESVLPHELSHVFDRRINYIWQEMDWMAVWESIHPFDDAYIYSYDNCYEYIEYTPDGEEDPDDVWFVDSYSRTYPTEDRAGIMEVLWNSGKSPDPYLEYEHILEKARLYCYILRQCFPSCNKSEGPFWEQFLGVIDESVLP